jgi:hypothetical protein
VSKHTHAACRLSAWGDARAASHTEFPMNSRALICICVHIRLPPPVHGASGAGHRRRGWQRPSARSPHTQFTTRLPEPCERLRNSVSSCLLTQARSQWVRLARTDHHQDRSSQPFSPGIPCTCPSPRSIVTWAPPAAPLCTRELLELLAARGMDSRVLTTGIAPAPFLTPPEPTLRIVAILLGRGLTGGASRS